MKNKDWWKFWKVDSTPLEPHEYSKPRYAEIDIKGHKGISEPVLAIVKSFGEKGRWKVRCGFEVMNYNYNQGAPLFIAEDTKTGEEHEIFSDSLTACFINYKIGYVHFPAGDMFKPGLPYWMTEQEKEYVCKAAEGIFKKVKERFLRVEDRKRKSSEKQALVNQIKERSRLQKLYCGE